MKRLWIEYILVWVVALILFFTLPQGALVADVMFSYIAEYSCVILTLLCIYLSLKLFATQRLRSSIKAGGETVFVRFSEIRLALLAIPLFLSLGVYAATLNSIGAFCALIILLSLGFVTPSRQELKSLTTTEGDEA